MEEVSYKVDAASAGMRLDRLLRRLLPDMPLSHIHRMIRKKQVRAGKKHPKAEGRFEEGETLLLFLDPADAEALRTRLAGAGGKAANGGRKTGTVRVLHDDGDVAAFDKPAGTAVHPGSGHRLEDTLLGELYAVYGEGGAVFRPGFAGRLDRDASGVQLAGISPAGLRGLEALSRERKIRKTYIVLARGGAEEGEEGTIRAGLEDSGRGGARMKAVSGGGAQAVTHYRVTGRLGDGALLEVTLETGRRHQIRAHLAAAGMPVAGDVRYGDPEWNAGLRRKGLKRLFLHCARAEFEHPVTGKKVTVRSELPGELAGYARGAGGASRREEGKRGRGSGKARRRPS
ncbi:MAG: RluA family pseudouridine synthase [Planctomycetes bacterium]|nr:RluA family pseudouridine synthase [Planctomycetota bacterium]